ncbi:uncharacterized protein LOC121598876 isoform X2 [Anopheles merus]|uniref:uncharacterized protein LOC121598876 isoform X2 n=1 Tax=Anopheles merus TaxID=30066 RepID=UPI001BE3D92D|nr:uncharacterized protein LOC121598876 isoform X2 [Anopheles merus]
MNKYVQPVCLWTMDSNQEMIVGKNGTIVGFGLNEQDVVSDQLKQALIGVIDPLTCIASDRAAFGPVLTSDMFCGKGQMGVGACNGDSGGGMFFEVGGKWFVRGLVSFTPLRGNTGLCDPLKYTAYTDVAKYLEWIKKYIDQRVLSFESDVLDIDYEEKLRLFNFKTCGVISAIDAIDGTTKWKLPWLGFVTPQNTNEYRCVVTLISEWYAVGPAHCFRNDGDEAFIILDVGNVYPNSSCIVSSAPHATAITCVHRPHKRPIRRIIVHPNFSPSNIEDNIALIKLLAPADTTLPYVKPICLSVTAELRTNAKTNLHVATDSTTDEHYYKNMPVRYLESAECMKQYTKQNITLNLGNNRLCAEIASKQDEQNCNALIEGSPLQEMKMVGGKEQYFLRGFELHGRACDFESASPMYINIERYIDWILYNMKYNVLEELDGNSAVNILQKTLRKEWSMLQQQPGKEKLGLFDMDTCGTPNALSNTINAFPWVGFLLDAKNHEDTYPSINSLVVLISKWYALAPYRSFHNDVHWRFLLLGQYNSDDSGDCYDNICRETHQVVEIENVIFPPEHLRYGFALIELLEPPNLDDKFVKPICLPFMDQLHRHNQTEVLISSKGDSYKIESKKLTTVDDRNCQQRFLLEKHFHSHNENYTCAIEAEKLRKIPLYSMLGSPMQKPIRYGESTRYFLYGMDIENVYGQYSLLPLKYGPYLFESVTKEALDWIVESMRVKWRQTSFISTSKNERVHLSPVQHASKRALFNFNTCGESSSSYPMPWMGNVFSNAPFFNLSRCLATLISDRYVVGSGYCFSDINPDKALQPKGSSYIHDTTEPTMATILRWLSLLLLWIHLNQM